MIIRKIGSLSLVSLLVLLTLASCSDKPENGGGSPKEDGKIQLTQKSVTIPELSASRSASFTFEVRNSGVGQITAYPLLKNAPNRLHIQSSESLGTISCPSGKDSECGSSNTVCLGTGCFKYLDAADRYKKKIKKGATEAWTVVITGGASDLNCGQAPNDVPDEYKQKYCGQIDVFSEGSNLPTTIYLQYSGVSGSPTFDRLSVELQGVVYGVKSQKVIHLTNDGQTPLEVTSIGYDDDKNGQFSVDPNAPFTLQANEEKEIKIAFEQASKPDTLLTLKTILKVAMKGHPEQEINVKAQTLSDEPVFNTNCPTLLSFTAADKTKTCDIYNKNPKNGQPMSVGTTSTARDSNFVAPSYTDIENNFTVPVGGEKELKITLPKSKPKEAYAILKIKPSVSQMQPYLSPYDIILNGDNPDVPYGRTYPSLTSDLTFSVNNQVIKYVIANLGTTKLTLAEPTYDTAALEFLEFDDPNGKPLSFPLEVEAQSYKVIGIKVKDLSKIDEKSAGKITFTRDTTDISNVFSSSVDEHRFGDSPVITYKQGNTPKVEIVNTVSEMVLGASIHLTAKNTEGRCTWISAGQPKEDRNFVYYTNKCEEGFTFHPVAKGDYSFFVKQITASNMADSDIITFKVK